MAYVHQETWVRFGTNGIGISDHQNHYSNGVKVGNWVENQYGDALKETNHGRQPLDMRTTTQADFIARTADPDANKKPTTIGNVSNVQMGQQREGEEETRQMISTYDLSISQVQGPKRVDTVLWSGVTKVDRNIPQGVHERSSLLEKKKAEWKAAKESTWQTAYSKQVKEQEAC